MELQSHLHFFVCYNSDSFSLALCSWCSCAPLDPHSRSGPSGLSTGRPLPACIVICSSRGSLFTEGWWPFKRRVWKWGWWWWWILFCVATADPGWGCFCCCEVNVHSGCFSSGRLQLLVVPGSRTSSKGTALSRKPWLHLLEAKTQFCPGRSRSTGFWAWAAPQGAAGQ